MQPLVSIVDDDESVRAALTGLVRSLGYRAAAFASAEDFFAAAGAAESACIVTDVHMPAGMSGLDLIERLKRDGSTAPVIVISAWQGEAEGACCVLTKPFAPEAFVACLERALANRSP